MKVKTWAKPSEQFSKLGKHSWSVPRLFELMKAILLGKKTIKVVRFIENPPPCKVED